MQIGFSVDGHLQLSRNLRILAVKLDSDIKKDFHKDAIDMVEAKSLKIFNSSGSNLQKSPTWKPLSPRTQSARAHRWGYYKQNPIALNKPLIWTGRLMNSRKKEATIQYGLLSFTAPYAPYHAKGGKNLPQRALVDFDNNLNREIVRLLQTKINKQVGIAGLQV